MRNAGLEETQAGIKTARRNINKLRYAGLDKAQAGIKIAGRNTNNLRHAVIPTPWICGLPGSSGRGISQARTLECVAISFSKAYGERHTWFFKALKEN